jgi:hypothetical protein
MQIAGSRTKAGPCTTRRRETRNASCAQAVLLSLAPVVGTARVIEAAPAVGMAVNIDIDRLLERP